MIRELVLHFCVPLSKKKIAFLLYKSCVRTLAPPRMPIVVRPELTIYYAEIYFFLNISFSPDTVILNVVNREKEQNKNSRNFLLRKERKLS